MKLFQYQCFDFKVTKSVLLVTCIHVLGFVITKLSQRKLKMITGEINVYFFSLNVTFLLILCCKAIYLSFQVQSILFSSTMCPQGIQFASVTDSGADTGFQRRRFKIRTAKVGAL